MKTITFFTAITLFAFFISCSEDDDTPEMIAVTSNSVENLYAPQEGGQGQPVSGAFTKFNFATGQTTSSDTDWDIAFRGSTIIVNGGVSSGTADEPDRTGNAAAYIASGTMASVTEVSTASFKQDTAEALAITTGSGNGWYIYAGEPTHLITPTPGKILVFRTNDDKYAKIEILSYYKDAPEAPNAFVDETPYYTFNYVYQPNEGTTTF
ncbi:HmuY family protein [uncultured Kriegella sp.]|uniref:HmuY family protein n=1 Tax=uncultured Kriegella sp. TaxID=1798910 RepID=UPI0030DA68D6|tara:strand:- start:99539 stop:100165 length:627 start_codon:yes stop_codon:yes gene_type:complete